MPAGKLLGALEYWLVQVEKETRSEPAQDHVVERADRNG